MNSIDDLVEHLDFLARNLSDYDESYVIGLLLLEVGVPTRGYGFDYIEEAVLLWYRGSMRSVSKEIYPAIAKKFAAYSTTSQVEKAIRSTIERAWKDRDGIWMTFFSKPNKPTNTEFISRMARILKMWRDRRELLKCAEGGKQSEF